MSFSRLLYQHKSRSAIALFLFVILSFVSFFAIDYVFKEKINEYIVYNVTDTFHKQRDVITKYALLAPGLLGDRIDGLLQNPFVARIIIKKNDQKVLYDKSKKNIEAENATLDPITIYQGNSAIDDAISIVVTPYNPLRHLSETLIFLSVFFMLLSGVGISTLFYTLFTGPMAKQFGRISRFTESFRDIYRSFTDQTHCEFRERVIQLANEYTSNRPRYDFEEKTNSIIKTINSLSEDLEQCIIQKEEISKALADSVNKIEQAQQSIIRFSHDINHPIGHIEILAKNILNSLASSNLKDAYLSVINLLITTSLAGIKPRAFLHIEKQLSSSAALSDTIYTDPKPTYEALSEHFHLPLMILYANRMYGKKIDLCIDDELLLNTQVSIPHPQIIQSVFYNLITNALIYGGGDRIIVRITRSMLDSHESLKVAVDGLINPLPDDVVEKVMSDDHKDSFVKSSSKELGGFGLLLTKKAIEHLGGRLVLTPGSASTFFEFPIKIERLRSDHLTHQQIYVAGNPSAEDLALLKLYMALKRGVALSTAMIVGADYAASTQVGSSAIYVLDNKTLKLISAGAAKNRFVYVTFSHEEYFSLRDTLPSNIEVQCASFGFLELISGISNLDGFLDGITSAASSRDEPGLLSLNGPRVLILDDQPAFVEAMIDLLKNDLPQIHFDYAATISDALNLLHKTDSSYDAFIIDMMLDGDKIGGVTAARKIREMLTELHRSDKKPLFFAISAGKAMLAKAQSTGVWDGIYQKSQSPSHGLSAMKNDMKRLLLPEQSCASTETTARYPHPDSSQHDDTSSLIVHDLVSAIMEVLPHKAEDVFLSIDELVDQYLNATTNSEAAVSLHKLAGKVMLFKEDIGDRIESISQKYGNNEAIMSEDIVFIKQFINNWREFRESGFI